MDANKFGFTQDLNRIALVRAFAAAAIFDGWSVEPTYGDSEPVQRAGKLRRDGFVIQFIAREYEPGKKWAGQASISIWAPDGMAIKPPDTYDWEAIQSGVRHCNLCDADDIEPIRYSFAGRCCKECRPKAAAEYEKPGWTN